MPTATAVDAPAEADAGAPATAVPTVDGDVTPEVAVLTVPAADGEPAGEDPAGFVAAPAADGVPAADVPAGEVAAPEADGVPAAAVGFAAADVPTAVDAGVPAVVVELMFDAGVLGFAAEPAGVAVAAGVQASSDIVIIAMTIFRRTGMRLFMNVLPKNVYPRTDSKHRMAGSVP